MLALGSYAAVGPPVIEAVMVAIHPQDTKSRCRSDGFGRYATLGYGRGPLPAVRRGTGVERLAG